MPLGASSRLGIIARIRRQARLRFMIVFPSASSVPALPPARPQRPSGPGPDAEGPQATR
jgi:hypothetical protein